jgi:hypothetical protein
VRGSRAVTSGSDVFVQGFRTGDADGSDCDMTPCRLVDMRRRVGGTHCFHLQS